MKLTFLSCFLWTLLPVLHVAQQQQEIIHIGYYNNADCLTEDYYSVGREALT